MEMFSGSCLCGAVTFEVTPPSKWCASCHCSMCRRAHGAAFVTWFGVQRGQFRFTSGEDRLSRYRSSPEAIRGFCSNCGSTMFFESTRWAEEIHIALAAMKTEIDLQPMAHTFFDDRAKWALILDRLPRFGGPSGMEMLADPIEVAIGAVDSRLRLAKSADAEDIDRLLGELAPIAWGCEKPSGMVENIQKYFRGHQPSWIILAEENGHTCAVAIVHAFPAPAAPGPQLVLDDIYVEAAARKKGLGSALMKAVSAIGQTLNAQIIYLSVRPENEAARRLYEKHGFEPQPEVNYEWSVD